MNPLPDLLNHPLTERLGWTLLHFVWQGALLAGFYAAARAAWRGRSANTRYLAGCLTLLLMAAAPVATFWVLSDGPAPRALPPAAPAVTTPAAPIAAPATAPPPVQISSRWLENFGAALDGTLPLLVAGWCLGVAILSTRLAVGWVRIRRARGQSGESLEAQLGASLRELQRRLRLSRPVRLVKSALVEVPTVLGWFRPVILLPASTLTGLSPVQIDLILAHELAHLRRWDHWVNLGQVILETLLFYHPAVWWVSRCVRAEREHCCDELAVAVCGNRLAYARALATLEELRQTPAHLALAAADGSLLARIRRILSLPDDERGGGRLSAAGAALMLIGVLMFAVGAALYTTAPRLFTSTARILVRPQHTAQAVQPFRPFAELTDPYFVLSELELIKARPVLERVVRQLKLAERWATGADPLGEIRAVDRLRERLEVRQIRGACVIDIRAHAPNPQEAAEIANAVVEAYRTWRLAVFSDETLQGLQILETELARQSNQVATLRRRVDEVRVQFSIPYSTSGQGGFAASLEREMVNSLASQLTLAQSEYVLYRSQLDRLRDLYAQKPREFQQAVLTAMPGEEVLLRLLDDLNTSEQMLAKLLQDFSPEYPEVKSAKAVRDQIEKQIQERIHGIMLGLETRVKSLQERYEALLKRVEEGKARVAEKATQAREHDALESDLEKEERVYDALYLRFLQESFDAKMPIEPSVAIIEQAQPISIPRRTSHPLDVSLMAAGAFTTLGGLALRLAGRKTDATS